MIEETGRVVEVDGDSIWVETQRVSACGGCAVRSGCGTGALAGFFGNRHNRVRVLNRISARPGEKIVIGLEEQALVRGSLAVYAVPLAGLLAGAVAGRVAGGSDFHSMMVAAFGLALGLMWLRRFGRRIRVDERYQAIALRRAG